ncbi:serine hydrolase [uncultured Croceitalea sp.]|uniref:serine hydrolase n=1 Tax=uncultured Croceitalea sp. TaxID=1798908 RepID=UPI003306575F
MKILSFLLFMAVFALNAHNGKIAYAYPCESKSIDARDSDWQSEEWISIEKNFGNPLKGIQDLSARYKVAYNPSENVLFFLTEINDDRFLEGDYYEFYINGIHHKNTGGVASLIFKNKKMQLRIHEEIKDPIHSPISEEDIAYKTRRTGQKWVIEVQVKLDGMITDYKTIGIDHFIVDVDSPNGDKTYLNWGIGYNGFWKEYNSGQLGDVVLLPKRPGFGSVSGRIKWKDSLEQTQKTIRITHKDRSHFWVETPLDSLGNFQLELPKGDYYISPSYELTNPFVGDGYGNQLRIDMNFRKHFTVSEASKSLEDITFPVYEELNYLYGKTGFIDRLSSTSVEQLDAFIRTQMMYYNVPGASVAVIKNGELVYDKVFGVRSTLNKMPITKNTHFQAASVTKSVFAFIVNRLVDRGEFNLDTPLHTLLEFENYSEDNRYKKITARMVLNHTSGMPNWAFGGPGGHTNEIKGELLFEPGLKFSYSGEAFEYLARVLEKVTEKNLNQLLKEEVIDALNIPELYFVGNENLEMAQGHLQSNPTYWGGYATEPGVAHSMLTNASNFAHFVKALIHKKGLSSERYGAMFNQDLLAPGFPTSPENNYWNLGMGLGFFVQETVVGKAVMHGGSNYDFQSEFVLYSESKNGFVIFTNSNTGHKLGQALGKYLFYGGVKK